VWLGRSQSKLVLVPLKVHPKPSFVWEPPMPTTQGQVAGEVIKDEPIAPGDVARVADGDGVTARPGSGLTVALEQSSLAAGLTRETDTLRRHRLRAAAVALAVFYGVYSGWQPLLTSRGPPGRPLRPRGGGRGPAGQPGVLLAPAAPRA
jgi:hypothetical protein